MSSSLRRIAVILAGVFVLGGCGSSGQRAVVTPLAVQPTKPRAVAEAEGSPLVEAPKAHRYNLDPARTKLEMYASDIVTGEHRGWFERWKGHVDIVPANDGPKESIPKVALIVAEIQTDSLVVDLAGAADFVKQKLLEVQRFPRATLTATLSKTDGDIPSEHVVQGIADIHGVKKQIRFVGDLTKDGESYRFKTSFVISRKDFDISYTPVEPFLKNDVRIVIDGVAHPEKVTAEEVP